MMPPSLVTKEKNRHVLLLLLVNSNAEIVLPFLTKCSLDQDLFSNHGYQLLNQHQRRSCCKGQNRATTVECFTVTPRGCYVLLIHFHKWFPYNLALAIKMNINKAKFNVKCIDVDLKPSPHQCCCLKHDVFIAMFGVANMSYTILSLKEAQQMHWICTPLMPKIVTACTSLEPFTISFNLKHRKLITNICHFEFWPLQCLQCPLLPKF